MRTHPTQPTQRLRYRFGWRWSNTHHKHLLRSRREGTAHTALRGFAPRSRLHGRTLDELLQRCCSPRPHFASAPARVAARVGPRICALRVDAAAALRGQTAAQPASRASTRPVCGGKEGVLARELKLALWWLDCVSGRCVRPAGQGLRLRGRSAGVPHHGRAGLRMRTLRRTGATTTTTKRAAPASWS